MTFQVSQILLDVQVPVSLETFTRRVSLVRRKKWYQICPSCLSYYSVSNEKEGFRISFLNGFPSRMAGGRGHCLGGEREKKSPIQSPAPFINFPVTQFFFWVVFPHT